MKDAKSSMDMETSNDVRLLLNEIDRRRSAVDFNLIFLERERQLLDIKACLESVYKEGPDSERARARRLVNQSIESSAFKVKENVQKTLQEVADAAVSRKPPTSSSAPSKSKFPSARLLATRSSSCSRCQKKAEPQVDNKRRVASAKSVGSLLPNRSPATAHSSRFVPNLQKTPKPLTELPQSSCSTFMLPTISTKSVLKNEALQPKYKSSVSQVPRSSPSFLPLGMWLQKDSVVMVSKATNTSEGENVGMATIRHPLPVLNDPVMKKPKSFQIQVLPSINIDSVDVPAENGLRTNTHYLEVKNEERPVVTGQAGKRNDADVSLSDPRTRRRSNAPIYSRNRSSVQNDVTWQAADKAQDRLTSQIVEDELLTYILERLTSKDDISVTESGRETESDGDVPEDVPVETAEHEHSHTAEQAPIEQVSVSNPSLVSVIDDIVVPTPVPTPPSPPSSPSISPLPLVITPVPSPPPELAATSEPEVIYRSTNIATQTSRCSSPEEKEITILTPKHSSISSPPSKYLPDDLKTPLPSVEDPLSPPERQPLCRSPVGPEMSPVENSLSRASTLSDTDVFNRSEAETVSYSVGQVHPALIQALLRDRSRRLPAYVAAGEDLSAGSHFLELDPELDKTDVTASTSMSEGEVRPYLYRWKSGADPSKPMHRRVGLRTAPLNLAQPYSAGDGRVHIGGFPKSTPSGRPAESTDRSFGEVTKDDPRLQLDAHRIGLHYRDLQQTTRYETLHALTDDDDPSEPSDFRPESCSDGEIRLQKFEDTGEASSN